MPAVASGSHRAAEGRARIAGARVLRRTPRPVVAPGAARPGGRRARRAVRSRDLRGRAGAAHGVGRARRIRARRPGPALRHRPALLHDGTEPPAVAALSERLLYPLWDAGFTVGHAVRTPAETLALAAERLDAATAVLDARLLAGDEELMRAAVDPVLGAVRADQDGFAEDLANDARERRERFGSTAYLLEPELKEGGGGLRDIHAFGWLQRVLDGRSRTTGCSGAPNVAPGRGRGVPDPRPERAAPAERPEVGPGAPGSTGRHRAGDGVRGRTPSAGGRRLDARDLRARTRRGRARRGRHHPSEPNRRRCAGPVDLADAAEAFALVASWVEEGRQPTAAELDALEALAWNPSRGTTRAVTRSSVCFARDLRPWTDCGRWIGPDCSFARSPSGPTSAAARSATPITATRWTCICFGRSSARLARSRRPTRRIPSRSWRSISSMIGTASCWARSCTTSARTAKGATWPSATGSRRDPRTDGRRGLDARAGHVHGRPAPAAAGHRHTPRPR